MTYVAEEISNEEVNNPVDIIMKLLEDFFFYVNYIYNSYNDYGIRPRKFVLRLAPQYVLVWYGSGLPKQVGRVRKELTCDLISGEKDTCRIYDMEYIRKFISDAPIASPRGILSAIHQAEAMRAWGMKRMAGVRRAQAEVERQNEKYREFLEAELAMKILTEKLQ